MVEVESTLSDDPPLLEVRPLQTSNPAFSEKFAQNFDYAGARSTAMTVQGTALKAFVLLVIMTTTACVAWTMIESGSMPYGVAIGSAIAAFVVGLITCFKPTIAMWTSPVYSALQGIFVGSISRAVEVRYPGVVVQAVALSGAVTFLMLFVYATGIIKVTGQLVTGIVAATGAIALLYLVNLIMRAFGADIPFIQSNGPFGIAFSVFVVGLAAFNLLLDFDFIDRGSKSGLSKQMEWYGAFGLMVTLVWLYLEVLRLLTKLNSRR